MEGKNIITISKLIPTDENNIEIIKVYNAILDDYKVQSYLKLHEENLEYVDNFLKLINEFASDIVNVCYSKIKDIAIETFYSQPVLELNLKLLLMIKF